jgi:hypothetical protein
MELKMKHRRGELTLTEKDVIMDNGSCFQLITQTYQDGWYECNYTLSSTTCRKLIKQSELTLVKTTGEGKGKLDYYKIKM